MYIEEGARTLQEIRKTREDAAITLKQAIKSGDPVIIFAARLNLENCRAIFEEATLFHDHPELYLQMLGDLLTSEAQTNNPE